MKKVLSIVAIAAVTALVACGPSAEQVAKEKAIQDSIANATAAAVTAAADSALKAQATATTDSAATTAAPAATETTTH